MELFTWLEKSNLPVSTILAPTDKGTPGFYVSGGEEKTGWQNSRGDRVAYASSLENHFRFQANLNSNTTPLRQK